MSKVNIAYKLKYLMNMWLKTEFYYKRYNYVNLPHKYGKLISLKMYLSTFLSSMWPTYWNENSARLFPPSPEMTFTSLTIIQYNSPFSSVIRTHEYTCTLIDSLHCPTRDIMRILSLYPLLASLISLLCRRELRRSRYRFLVLCLGF